MQTQPLAAGCGCPDAVCRAGRRAWKQPHLACGSAPPSLLGWAFATAMLEALVAACMARLRVTWRHEGRDKSHGSRRAAGVQQGRSTHGMCRMCSSKFGDSRDSPRPHLALGSLAGAARGGPVGRRAVSWATAAALTHCSRCRSASWQPSCDQPSWTVAAHAVASGSRELTTGRPWRCRPGSAENRRWSSHSWAWLLCGDGKRAFSGEW